MYSSQYCAVRGLETAQAYLGIIYYLIQLITTNKHWFEHQFLYEQTLICMDVFVLVCVHAVCFVAVPLHMGGGLRT